MPCSLLVVGVGMVLAVTVTGCTVLDSSAPNTSPSDSASASPSASAPATHASEPSAEAPIASAPPTTRDDQSPRLFDGFLGNEMIIEPVDSGKRPGATGTVTLNKEGEPAYYTVASGDYLDQILARLYMDPYYLENLNSVRRDGSLGDYYVGDVLNLDPTTIAYVGSDSGVVYDNPIITPHPKQVMPSF